MTLSRRRFWSYAAPAIVLAPSLMRVSAAALVEPIRYVTMTADMHVINIPLSFSELVTATLRAHPREIAKSVEYNNALWAYLVEGNAQPS